MARTTLSMPDDLYNRWLLADKRINLSALLRDALREKLKTPATQLRRPTQSGSTSSYVRCRRHSTYSLLTHPTSPHHTGTVGYAPPPPRDGRAFCSQVR